MLVGLEDEKSSDIPNDTLLRCRWGNVGISSNDRRRVGISESIATDDDGKRGCHVCTAITDGTEIVLTSVEAAVVVETSGVRLARWLDAFRVGSCSC